MEPCRPSGQYPAIYLVCPRSRRNHPHFPSPSILTGFSSLNTEAERLLWSIPPLTPSTHKIRIGVSSYTIRHSWSHAQHLLNIPTLHQLQASDIRRKLEFNPKEVGRTYLFSPPFSTAVLQITVLWCTCNLCSCRFPILASFVILFSLFFLCYPLPLTFLPCPLQAHFSLSPKANMDNLRMRWEPLCIHSISLTVPLPCPYSLVFLSSLGPEATRPTLDQWPKNYA